MNPDDVARRIAHHNGFELQELLTLRGSSAALSCARRELYAVLVAPPWCWTHKTIAAYVGRCKESVGALLASKGWMQSLPYLASDGQLYERALRTHRPGSLQTPKTATGRAA